MVPNEILQSVFMIKYGTQMGSSIYVSIDNSDYLVTAKHLFANVPNKTEVDIEIIKDNGLLKFKPTLLIHDNILIDIAVLDLKTNNLKEIRFDIGSKGYSLSQDSYFVGFPFGLKMDNIPASINSGFPLPFVKKGIISGFITSNSVTQIFLDGHNNKGFSGGPVVIENIGSTSKNKMHVIGIVSSYLDEKKIIKTPFGDIPNSENTGIVLSYAFDHVFEIIKKK